MHRMKIGLAAAGILLVVTVIFYATATKSVSNTAVEEAEQNLGRAERAFAELGRLRAAEAAMQTLDIARRPTVVAVFANSGDAVADAAFTECNQINKQLEKEGRRAAIVAVLDANGKVVARDLDRNALAGEDLKAQHAAVAHALRGRPSKDVWFFDKGIKEFAVAPISRADGTIAGALLIGHALSARKAQDTRDELGVEIGYFHTPAPGAASDKAAMDVSSFGSPGDPKREDTNKTQFLGTIAFGPEKLAESALEKRRPTEKPVRVTIDGRDYLALAAPLLGNFEDRRTGVVLASSISDAADREGGLGIKILALGLLGILVSLAAAVLTAKRFLGPLDKIELGVGEIINGNIDYTFKPVGPDFEGLSNALNVMLARLLGREEPNEDAVEEEEDEGGSHVWKAEQMIIDEGDGAGTQGASALAQEGEAAYYPRLFNEYAAALHSTGKPSEGLSVPAFMAKLRLTEAGLKEKWSCRMVRFQLAMRDKDVVFRAVKLD